MLKKLYLSPLGVFISGILHVAAVFPGTFMVYGYYNRKDRKFKKHTRFSASAKFINKKNLNIADHVWIGHYTLLDGTGEVNIGEGVQISSHSVIYSHSSQDSIRLAGKDFIKKSPQNRPGYKIKPVTIGDYTFIGTSSVILPGATIGKGCIIGAGSVISGNIPDYAIVTGNPSKIIGDTRERDKSRFKKLIDKELYYDF